MTMTAFLFGAGDFPMDSMFHTALISFIPRCNPRSQIRSPFGALVHKRMGTWSNFLLVLSKETFAFAVKILTPQAGQAGASLPNMRDMISGYSFRIVYTIIYYIIYIEWPVRFWNWQVQWTPNLPASRSKLWYVMLCPNSHPAQETFLSQDPNPTAWKTDVTQMSTSHRSTLQEILDQLKIGHETNPLVPKNCLDMFRLFSISSNTSLNLSFSFPKCGEHTLYRFCFCSVAHPSTLILTDLRNSQGLLS